MTHYRYIPNETNKYNTTEELNKKILKQMKFKKKKKKNKQNSKKSINKEFEYFLLHFKNNDLSFSVAKGL